jgi:hypothetical protein
MNLILSRIVASQAVDEVLRIGGWFWRSRSGDSPNLIPGLAVIFALLLGAFTTHAQDTATTYDLSPQFTAGQSARYEFWTQIRQQAKLKIGQRTQDADATQLFTGEMSWAIDRVLLDGGAVATMTIDWVKAEATQGDTTVVSDSRQGSSDSPALHQLLKAISQVPLTVTMNDDGTIKEIEGMAAMKRKTKAPDQLPDELEFIETAADLAVLMHGPSQIDVGDTFDADFKWKHELGFMHEDWRYTFERVESMNGIEVATVSGQAKLRLEVDESQRPAGAPPLSARLADGDLETQILFDLSRNEVLARTTTRREHIIASVKLPDGGAFQRDMKEDVTTQLLRIGEK